MKDVDAILPTIAEAERAQKPVYVIMNQVPPNAPKLVRRRQLGIQRDYNIRVLSLCLSRRADFEYCDAHGLSAAEYNPQGAAASEIEKLYILVQAILRVAEAGKHPKQLASPEKLETRQSPETHQADDVETIEPESREAFQPGIAEPIQPGIPEAIVEKGS
jgi:hypothetical protein